MNCQEVRQLLNPYSDGELDLLRNIQIEEHIAGCAECDEQQKNLQSLRAAISSPSLRYKAPSSLRAQICPVNPATPDRRRSSMRPVAVAASVLMMLGMSVIIATRMSPTATSTDEQIAQWVVADHVRSSQVDHLTDVASSDRHTVKPWFQGKLDFACQVPDLAAEGYPLSGGRLDYLIDHPVAALVYHRRLHTINVLTWTANNDDVKTVRRLTRQGFHIRYWQRSQMIYWAISDLNDHELDEFVQLFQDAIPQANP